MHLRRLQRVFAKHPLFVVTTCTEGRRRILADARVHRLLLNEWIRMPDRHGWQAGRYVIMPDHVHLFMRSVGGGRRDSSLSEAVAGWKAWSAKAMARDLGIVPPVWKREFFDEVVVGESLAAKRWEYIRANPDRAGLVALGTPWPYAGAVHFENWRVVLRQPRVGC
jgi:putative transposase